MDVKFQRNFRITIDVADGQQVIIEPPLTVYINIVRNAGAGLNSLVMQIINLGPETRKQIFQDWNLWDYNRKITVEAGYTNLTKVFQGSIREANSGRNGTEIITTIKSIDGAYDTPNAMTFQTLQAGTDIKEIFKTLINGFPNMSLGAIGDFDTKFSRPVILDGNTWDLLKTYSNNQCFIDLEKVYVLPANQVIEGDESILTIDASTGLLETPRREQNYMILKTLFEPRLRMGQQVTMKSLILPEYDGVYKAIGVTHEGIISEAKNGNCTTTMILYSGEAYGGLKLVNG